MFIDLHVHVRGTITATAVRRLAVRNGVAVLQSAIDAHGYGWRDFSSFLRIYDEVSSVIQTANDLEDIAYDYLKNVARHGTLYVEFMLSPRDLLRTGVSFQDQVAAIRYASSKAKEEYGIECRLISTAVRHLGPLAAIEAARIATICGDNFVVGFGLTGDKRRFRISDFGSAFDIARDAGLKLTAHVGEHGEPNTILDAVDCLLLDRIGHGVRAAESESVMRQISASRIPMEICLSSNVALGLYPSIEQHPISILAEAGCVVTLGTDDPSYFSTSPQREYELAGQVLRFGPNAVEISKQAVDAAFCDAATKAEIKSKIR